MSRLQEEVLNAIGDGVSWAIVGRIFWNPIVGLASDEFAECRSFARSEPALTSAMVSPMSEAVQALREKRHEIRRAGLAPGKRAVGDTNGEDSGPSRPRGGAKKARKTGGGNDSGGADGDNSGEGGGGGDGSRSGGGSGGGGGGGASTGGKGAKGGQQTGAKPPADVAAKYRKMKLAEIQAELGATKKACHFFFKTDRGCVKGNECPFAHM
jgi:hypothetical protein